MEEKKLIHQVDSLLALAKLLVKEATGLRQGLSAKSSQAPRKGLQKETKEKLTSKRYKTAFKKNKTD